MYKNKGDLSFEDKTKPWGLDQKLLSNGAAYGDLDNDGDLDLVVNNVDSEVSIYKNNANANAHNFIRFKLKGAGRNAKVSIHSGEEVQMVENLEFLK